MDLSRHRSIALLTTLTLSAVPAAALASGRDHAEDDAPRSTTPAATTPAPTTPAQATSATVAFALPPGFQPEGIAAGPNGKLYVGSIPTGAIFRADPRTGKGSVLVPPHAGRAAIGLKVAEGKLIVAGGPTGKAFVYDARTGADVEEVPLTTAPSFINDVAIGKHAAFFTDSQQPQLYRVALRPGGGHHGEDDDSGHHGAGDDSGHHGAGNDDANHHASGDDDSGHHGTGDDDSGHHGVKSSASGDRGAKRGAYVATTVKITGALQYDADPSTFEANGIVALPGGRRVLIVQSRTGKLFRVDTVTGASVEVPLTGGTLINGDGLLLKGNTLYAVQNQLNQIAVVKLDEHARSGAIQRTITSPLFRVPTTVARLGGALFAVNARFDTAPTPTTDYDVVRVNTH